MSDNKYNWKLNFFTIWAGQGISLITSAVLQTAIIWYLADKTGSAAVLSIAALVGFLPQAVLGPMAGVFVDRYNKKHIMIGADLFIAAAGAVLAIATLFMDLPLWMIMSVLLIRSIGSAFHYPALGAITPLMVPEDKLTKCAGYSQSIQSASFIISPAIAAFLYSVWELNAIIAFDVVGAIVACSATAIIKIPNLKVRKPEAKIDFVREMKEGYNVLRQDKGLFSLLWIGAVYMLFFMPIGALYPLMSLDYFGGTPVHASIVEISFSAGMLLGGLLLGIWGGFKNRAVSIICSILLMGVSLTVSGLLPKTGYPAFVICCAFMGFSGPLYNGVHTALLQERISPEYLGRVFSLIGSIISLAMPLGLMLAGAFADKIGINLWFFYTGLLITCIAIVSPLFPSFRSLGNMDDRPVKS